MSWGDVWVSADDVRPTIDEGGPQPPWVLAGAISRDERAFIEAMQQLRNTRDSHARAVDFYLQLHTPKVALGPAGGKNVQMTFEPNGLWVAVDVTVDEPRFVAFTQRVHASTLPRRKPEAQPGQTRRPLAVLALRGRARSRASALEWVYRAPRT